MEFLSTFLPIILYIVAIVLLVILIILGLRLLKLLDKVDALVDNIEEKVNTFNGALSVVKTAADGIASISDSVLFFFFFRVVVGCNGLKIQEGEDI